MEDHGPVTESPTPGEDDPGVTGDPDGAHDPVPSARPGSPGSPAATKRAWVAVVVLVLLHVLLQWKIVEPPLPKPPPPDRTSAGGVMLLMGRYAVATNRLAPGTGGQMLAELDPKAKRWEDRIRLAAVAAELGGDDGSEAAHERLAQVAAESDLTELARADVLAFQALYEDGPAALSPDQRSRVEAHGWFGQLALSKGLDDADPLRAPVLAKAQRLIAVGAVVALLGGCAFMLGLGLLLVAIPFRLGRGVPRSLYRPSDRAGSAYLETFALFLAGMLVIAVVSRLAAGLLGTNPSRLLVWLLLLVPLWPLRRGEERARWQLALGWHRGRGLLREVGAGVVGYVAGLPIFGCGVVLTLLLVTLLQHLQGDADPTHPIVNEAGQGGVAAALALYALAAVWAPVVEETLFRGAFYHHLRSRLGPISTGLVVAFVFAVVHPQGLGAVPALMSLAVVFALIREWRGSIVASATAHALHNGALVTTLLLVLG
jgi:membrane protease YdiL (CAAX protease family)